MSILIFSIFSLLQVVAAPAARPETLVEDVRRFEAAQTNQARFEALTMMLRDRGFVYDVQPFTIEKPVGKELRREGRNVIVSFGEGPDEIVIGAHFDAARLPDGSLSRGAVDNAASSVILVRLAEALRAEKLPARIKVVWFDMEELGLIGSQRYVQSQASPPPAAMVNFDINAYGDTVVFGPSKREDNKALRRAFVETCAAEDRSCVGFPQMPPGDDRSFMSAGIPTLSIAMVPARDVHQLWLMLNAGADSGLAQGTVPEILRTIHTAQDTSAKVDGEAMARALRFALSLVRNVVRR
ncbi:MAG TPA: M28 family peptidase [Vicinamibacterales bacterium]|nr:M28 family peptidase [Vicinamibacterales bacterium]